MCFAETRARYTNTAGCGHLILQGDVFAFNKRDKTTLCSKCWKNLKTREGLRRHLAIQQEMKLD